jgi:hypothetical protein
MLTIEIERNLCKEKKLVNTHFLYLFKYYNSLIAGERPICIKCVRSALFKWQSNSLFLRLSFISKTVITVLINFESFKLLIWNRNTKLAQYEVFSGKNYSFKLWFQCEQILKYKLSFLINSNRAYFTLLEEVSNFNLNSNPNY